MLILWRHKFFIKWSITSIVTFILCRHFVILRSLWATFVLIFIWFYINFFSSRGLLVSVFLLRKNQLPWFIFNWISFRECQECLGDYILLEHFFMSENISKVTNEPFFFVQLEKRNIYIYIVFCLTKRCKFLNPIKIRSQLFLFTGCWTWYHGGWPADYLHAGWRVLHCEEVY